MANRILPEDRVIDYFMTAGLAAAAQTFHTVKRIMANREQQATPATAKRAAVKHKKRAVQATPDVSATPPMNIAPA